MNDFQPTTMSKYKYICDGIWEERNIRKTLWNILSACKTKGKSNEGLALLAFILVIFRKCKYAVEQWRTVQK